MNKYLIVRNIAIVLFLIPFIVYFVSAETFVLNQFGDGTTTGNLSFNGSNYIAKSIQIPITSTLTIANLTISGSMSFDYDDSGDEYGLDESSGLWENDSFINDEDYTTGALCYVGDSAKYYVNYSKPTNVLPQSIIQWSYGSTPDIRYVFNVSIPTSCWSQSKLQFLVDAKCTNPDSLRLLCYNGSIFINLSTTPENRDFLFEESMWWAYVPENVSITSNGTIIYSSLIVNSTIPLHLNLSVLQKQFLVQSEVYLNFTSITPSYISYSNLNFTYNLSLVPNAKWLNNSVWTQSIETSESATLSKYINNSGSSNATNCNITISQRIGDYITFNDSNFSLIIGTNYPITLTLNPSLNIPSSAFETGYANIECASSVGKVNSLSDLPITITATSSASAGGGGGGGGITISEFTSFASGNRFDLLYFILPSSDAVDKSFEIGTTRIVDDCTIVESSDNFESYSCTPDAQKVVVRRVRDLDEVRFTFSEKVEILVQSKNLEALTLYGNVRVINLAGRLFGLPAYIPVSLGVIVLIWLLFASARVRRSRRLSRGLDWRDFL